MYLYIDDDHFQPETNINARSLKLEVVEKNHVLQIFKKPLWQIIILKNP